MGCMCMECKYADIVTDSRGAYHRICTKCESPMFLNTVSTAFGCCEYGAIELDESEGADDEKDS